MNTRTQIPWLLGRIGLSLILLLELLAGAFAAADGPKQVQAAPQAWQTEPAPVQVEETAHSIQSLADLTWQIETVDDGGDAGWYASLAVDKYDSPHISYCRGTEQACDGLRHASHNGSAWTTETVDGAAGVGAYTSLALDSYGYSHVSYHDSNQGALKYAYYSGSAWVSETVDSLGFAGMYTSLALAGNDHPHISYYEIEGADLKYATYNGSDWALETVDSAGNVGKYTSLALDGANRPHISYYDHTNGNLKYAHYNGFAWISETVDSAGDVGQYTSLALDAGGDAHISYYEVTNGNLKYAHYDGSTWISETVDNAGDVGQYTSLALDADGYPHIGYYDVTNGNLKYAHYDGSTWISETVDNAGDVGQYASLALGTGDRPRIGYYDDSNDNLKYAVGPPPPVPLESVSLNGPATALTGEAVVFTATVSPPDATPPITYTWQAIEQSTVVTTTSDTSNTVSFAWADPGTKTVTVTAENCGGRDSDMVTINIEAPPPVCPVPLSAVDLGGPTTVVSGTAAVFTATAGPADATPPITFTWEASEWEAPLVEVLDVPTSTQVITWQVSGDQAITLTAANCGGALTTHRQVEVAPQPLPDLLVTDIEVDGNQIYFQLMNAGTAATSHIFRMTLSVDGFAVHQLWWTSDLEPGERLSVGSPSPIICSEEEDTIEICLDTDGVIMEEDETNNCRQEIRICDAQPPEVVSGPEVTDIMTNSATIHWETDEPAVGIVHYDYMAGQYRHTAPYPPPEQSLTHTVTLDNLIPSRLYQYKLHNQDPSDNEHWSRIFYFETAPDTDHEPEITGMQVSPVRDGSDVYSIQATVSYTQAVERVEFLFDGMPIAADYSGRFDLATGETTYEGIINPRRVGLEPGEFYGVQHAVQASAFSYAGAGNYFPYQFAPQDMVVDIDLEFLSPYPNHTVYIIEPQVPPGREIWVEIFAAEYRGECAWDHSGNDPDPGLNPPRCDEVMHEVAQVDLYIDDTLVMTRTPPSDAFRTAYIWQLDGMPPGNHSICARAEASNGFDEYNCLIVKIVQREPCISLTRRVTYEDNALQVQLRVENEASVTLDALIERIEENVTGLQAIDETSGSYHLTSGYTGWDNDEQNVNEITIDFTRGGASDGLHLNPGEAFTVTYGLVPVLFEDEMTYAIGAEPVILYRAGQTEPEIYDLPSPYAYPVTGSGVGLLSYAVSYALEHADYLIVTNPGRLYALYVDDEVDTLLSTMATLAYLKQGALGYLRTYDENTLDELVDPDFDLWATQLHSNFSTPDGGYLLIVGETEIVVAYGPWGVSLSDHNYADFTGATVLPDMIVSRIIGDSAADLTIPIQTSIGVHMGNPGYGFDFSHALLTSGTGEGTSTFMSHVDDLADILEPEVSTAKVHWKHSIPVRSFNWAFGEHDDLAAGDVNDDGVDEIVIADRDDHFYILDTNGTLLGEFNREGISNEFEEGDRLAVGDVRFNPGEEILIGDRNDNIYVYDQYGQELNHFDVDFAMFDGLATGDVDDDGMDEIVYVSWDQDLIAIYEGCGTFIHSFVHYSSKHDSVAVADVCEDDAAEIIVANRSQDVIYVYRPDGSLFTTFHLWDHRPFDKGDDLAAGDFVGSDGKAEILIGDQTGSVWAWTYYSTTDTVEFTVTVGFNPYDFQQYDAIAAGDMVGDYHDEILLANQIGRIRVLDENYCDRMHADFRAQTQGRDILAYRGHGSCTGWSCGLTPFRFSPDNPLDFGGVNPAAFGFTCLSGNYHDPRKWGIQDHNIAEALMQNGVAAYLGSTEVSYRGANWDAAQYLFNNWDGSVPVGDAFYGLECHKWLEDDPYWIYEYNLYGDPKYGAVTQRLSDSAAPAAAIQSPASNLVVSVPDYEVAQVDGLDQAEIPGGALWLEGGDYRVPYWITTLDYPAGERVQEVTLLDRSGLITDTGLLIPIETLATDCPCTAGTLEPVAPPNLEDWDGWFNGPGEVYDWRIEDHPDGSSTLIVAIYPFYYNPLTTDVKFYTSYTFDLQTITTTAAIERLVVTQAPYLPGDEVQVDLWLDNDGEAQDVLVSAVIESAGTGDLAGGLPLRVLNNLSDWSSLTLSWDSSGVEQGDYVIAVELKDSEGNVLDTATEEFALGITAGEVTTLTATPDLFKPGDTIAISMVFSNTGTVLVTGTAIIRVQPTDSVTATATFTHTVANLAPAEAITFDDAWDTTGAAEGDYRILGYVQYDARTTAPKVITVSTERRVYLPLIVRN